MDIEIGAFDPEAASPEEWQRFHVFRRQRDEEVNPGDPSWNDRTAEAWMRRQDPQMDEQYYAVHDPSLGEIVGFLTFGVTREDSPSHEGKKEEAQINIEVLHSHRRQGIGSRLRTEALRLAEEHGRTLLVGYTQEPDGYTVLRAWGAHFARTSRQSRLALEAVDWSMVRGWAKEGPARSEES